ncbi:MAG: F0F1 ATP synthase subunit delta [Sedimenticola sp.]|jgi:F-type H+-transporting ATPase subunit delta|nr:MAG: F0F1 ATP synthase subunit delta [Sedimenticola sp.]
MAGETSTIARPYAEAIFARAKETESLAAWSDALSFLTSMVADPLMGKAIANPKFDQQTLTNLVLEVSGDHLNAEGQNLAKLLVKNDRLSIAGEIARMFEALKAEDQRMLNVHVRSAFALKPEQEKQIAEALKAKLGRDITITSERDAELIGGVHIRAGDMVIDASVSGQLQQLAHELGI